jgi:Sec-independent protein translocase protein TatA
MAIGTTEIIIIVAAAIFLFGGKKVIDWARSAGQAKRVYEEEVEASKAKTSDKKAPAKAPVKKSAKKK